MSKLDRRPWPPFIPKALDDAGLSAAEFRVACRIARRAGANGDCWEGAKSIARACRLHKNTVWAALKSLMDRGMVESHERKGETTIFTLNHPDKWKERGTKEEPRLSQSERQVARPKRRAGGLSQSESHKGVPLKAVGEIEEENETFRQDGQPQEEIAVPTHRFQSLKPK